jgi:hypothetical protein
MNEAGPATDTAADTTAAAAAADVAKVPQEPHSGAAATAPPKEPDPLFFPMLLRTQRRMERDARSAKLSSLRIV